MPGLLRGIARTAVVAGTATAVSNRVSRRQANRWAGQEQAQAPPQYYEPPPQPAQAPAVAAPAPDPIEQLTQLADLKERGLLTDAEFTAQKRKLLGT